MVIVPPVHYHKSEPPSTCFHISSHPIMIAQSDTEWYRYRSYQQTSHLNQLYLGLLNRTHILRVSTISRNK